MTKATQKPSLKRRAAMLSQSIAIAAGICVIAYGAVSLVAGRSASTALGSTFLHRIDRVTALCGSVGGAPRCRRWKSG